MTACFRIDTVTCDNCRPHVFGSWNELLNWYDPWVDRNKQFLENQDKYRELLLKFAEALPANPSVKAHPIPCPYKVPKR